MPEQSPSASRDAACERTRTTDLLQLRVIIQALQGVAQGCKSRMSKGLPLLSFAQCCTVLRSQWCQSGVNQPHICLILWLIVSPCESTSGRYNPMQLTGEPLRPPHTRRSPALARYWWTNLTAMDPSPTAEATRLIEPLRASPAANTPGRLASKGYGSRECPAHTSPWSADRSKASPVRMKPLSSSSTAAWSQPVLASAPMKTKRDRAQRVRRAPERLSSTPIPSNWFSPMSSRISVRASNSTFSASLILCTR
jgi:hypothetical protein